MLSIEYSLLAWQFISNSVFRLFSGPSYVVYFRGNLSSPLTRETTLIYVSIKPPAMCSVGYKQRFVSSLVKHIRWLFAICYLSCRQKTYLQSYDNTNWLHNCLSPMELLIQMIPQRNNIEVNAKPQWDDKQRPSNHLGFVYLSLLRLLFLDLPGYRQINYRKWHLSPKQQAFSVI